MENKILATYFDEKNNFYSYAWLESEEDVEFWLEENKERYSSIEIIEIGNVRTLYVSE